jgi:hypothetical protein
MRVVHAVAPPEQGDPHWVIVGFARFNEYPASVIFPSSWRPYLDGFGRERQNPRLKSLCRRDSGVLRMRTRTALALTTWLSVEQAMTWRLDA